MNPLRRTTTENNARAGEGDPLEPQLEGAVLRATTGEGPVYVDGLALLATREGLTLLLEGEPAKVWPWQEIAGFNADRSGEDPRGVQMQVLEVHASGLSLEFLAPAPDLSTFLAGLAVAPTRWWPQTVASASPSLGAQFAAVFSVAVTSGRAAHARAGAALSAASKRFDELVDKLLAHLGIHRGRHVARSARLAPFLLTACLLALLAGGTFGGSAQARAHDPAGGNVGNRNLAKTFGGKSSAIMALPAATNAPAPAPPSLADAPALSSHEIFGFAPYWNLPDSQNFDVADLSTVAYFSVDVNGDGSIDRSGPGWAGYESQDLANLVTRAHQSGDRVVLTATCFDQGALDELTSSPSAGTTLASNLVALVKAKNLDGVNIDFEGEGSGDRAGLDRVMADVSSAVHGANPHWQVTMDTYASAAADSGGFYDIAGLANSVDAFFVMAYDMNSRTQPSPTAPLSGPSFSDLEAVEQYTSVVPASKIVLGVPYYGYDWPTSGPQAGASATGPPTPLSYSEIASSGHPVYWDSTTNTPWTSYQVGNQWHQTWFDDPTSLALKADLANYFHLRGLGIWALGMDGNDPSMIAALLGQSPVAKDYSPSPGALAASTPTPPAGGYTYTGVWQGKKVQLTAVKAGTTPPPAGKPLGRLSSFTTNDPSAVCLETGTPLVVAAVTGSVGTYEATAAKPADCAAGTWVFRVSKSTTTTTGSGVKAGPPGTTGTTGAPGTSTTEPPTTTTTTTEPTTTTTTTEPTTTTSTTTTTTTSNTTETSNTTSTTSTTSTTDTNNTT